MWWAVNFAEKFIPPRLSDRRLTVRLCAGWMDELTKIGRHFSVYFSAVALLHVACEILRNGYNDELMDIVVTILERNSTELSSDPSELNASEVVELLQKSAVEHMTVYRQLLARNFSSVASVVTTDFEALYAYKRGDYQQCLRLSTQNVYTLLYAVRRQAFTPFREFIQLLDDDIVSLIALTTIVTEGTSDRRYVCISQLTLSMYLMTQCQLKLRHSVTLLAQTLVYIEEAQMKHPRYRILDQLTLQFIERKANLTMK